MINAMGSVQSKNKLTNSFCENGRDDQAVRKRALDVSRSFIVQAPAGSGKTALLTQRFLSLLTVVEHEPEECLALTFTRKAAAEMRDRILLALSRAQTSEAPEDPFQYTTWTLARRVLMRDAQESWDLISNPHRLRIQTMDALCSNITHSMPIVSGLGAGIKVLEDPNQLYDLASQNLLKSVETQDAWSESLRCFLIHLDNNLNLAKRLLSGMLSHREQWLPHVGQSMSAHNARALLEASLMRIVSEALNDLVKAIPQGCEELFELAHFAATQLKAVHKNAKTHDSNKASAITHCAHLKTWPDSSLEALESWSGIAELLLTSADDWRKTVTHAQGFPSAQSASSTEEKKHFQWMKQQMLAWLERLQEFPKFLDKLRVFRECPPLRYTEAQWKMVEALLNVLPVLVAELMLLFQENNAVDFSEISLAARRALGSEDTPSDLSLALDYKIRHILVDEFQDTSIPQLRLIEQLTSGWQRNDGRTLFLVGDPMQSIYRFRQAEVSLFLKAKQYGINDISLESLVLTANFRSDPTLVTWVNNYFTDLFPKEDDFMTGAIAFHPSIAAQSQLNNSGAVAQAFVAVHSVTLETEALKIQELVRAAQDLESKGSIALLVRSRSQLKNILPILRASGIHYQGIELELLHQRTVVQDLLALTRSLIHLGDRIAWLALLRGPRVGMSLNDLYLIANYQPKLPIWWTLQRYCEVEGLSISAREALARIVPCLESALMNQGRVPLMNWVLDTWLSLGGAIALENNYDLQDVESFLNILDREQDRLNFFEVGVLEERFQSLYAKPTSTVEQSLQVMTIHKAKGLEFDTVILAGLGRRSRADYEKLLLWEERVTSNNAPYLILAPIKSRSETEDPIYRYLKLQNQKRSQFEADRLLYVAMTRARKRLFCLSHAELKSEAAEN